MTIEAATELVEQRYQAVALKLAEHGIAPAPLSKSLREIAIFDELSGEYTSPSQRYEDATGKLAFYRQKLNDYRGMEEPELTLYVVQMLQEALRGI